MKRLAFFITLFFLCFLSYSQTSIQEDLEMFEAGKILRCSTAGHPKAHGVDMSVAYPESWFIVDKESPYTEIIQGENVSLVIAVVDMKSEYENLSDEEMEKIILTNEYVMARLTEGIKIIALENTDRYERLTQIALYYHRLIDQNGKYITTQYVYGHRFIYDGNLIEISLIYNVNVNDIDIDDEAATEEIMRPFIKLAMLISDTITIHGTSKNIY